MTLAASDAPYKISRTASGIQYRDISNPFVSWLTFANPGMLSRGNLWSFDHAIRNLPDDLPIVEIGSFCGLSTNLLDYYRRKHGRQSTVFTCDRWEFEGSAAELGDSGIAMSDYRAFVRESFMRNVRFFSQGRLPHTVEVFSDEFFDLWTRRARVTDVFDRGVTLGGPIGFCYVDGNHTYDFARRDFENADRHLAIGGYILFDDSADGSEWGANLVCREIAQLDRYELVIRNPNYLFRKLA